MLYAPKRYLILIEAKFRSGNTSANSSKNDIPGRSPRTREGILERYRAELLPPDSIFTPAANVPLFSQLYRNLVFAIWMANKLDVEWRLVNLTSSLLSSEQSVEQLTTFTKAVLPENMRRRFVRYTWEQLFRDRGEGNDDLQELDTYLRFKSANCGRAFDILTEALRC
jgi:hypothetical protein